MKKWAGIALMLAGVLIALVFWYQFNQQLESYDPIGGQLGIVCDVCPGFGLAVILCLVGLGLLAAAQRRK